ncbi:MAG: YggT family protein [Fimbriimonadales bacterium]|nr:YggT family protein [Fimbriimonadales bacterium]MCS7191294.1 YggT family protein [Fimbriimonadales bacterium]
MLSPIDLLILVLQGITIILIISVVFSWIRFAGGRVPRYNPVVRFIDRVSDAILNPIRQVQDRLFRSAGMHFVPIDLSPLIAIMFIQFLIALLRGLQ